MRGSEQRLAVLRIGLTRVVLGGRNDLELVDCGGAAAAQVDPEAHAHPEGALARLRSSITSLTVRAGEPARRVPPPGTRRNSPRGEAVEPLRSAAGGEAIP